MLRLTKRSEYGLMALAFMAKRREGYCSVREIVAHLGTPRRLLAEVLKALSSAQLVEATRGPGGGYCLRKDPSEVPLSEVIEILEGPVQMAECSNGGVCNYLSVCEIQDGVERVAQEIVAVLERYTLADICEPTPTTLSAPSSSSASNSPSKA